MLKKLTGEKSKKREFVERKASIHICDATCEINCIREVTIKFALLGSLNDIP